MSPVSSCIDSNDKSLSDRMDDRISRQHTLLVVAQEIQIQETPIQRTAAYLNSKLFSMI